MKVVARRERTGAAVTVVLLDWSVREQMQLLHYLRTQTLARAAYEVMVVEFYGRESAVVGGYRDMIDTWVLLEMPAACCYHKHLMYNAGIVLAQGAVVVFCDSDAMVRPTFLERIAERFAGPASGVLHLDQFRNARQDLYPFRYPSFEEVVGPGCINNVDGRPRGLSAVADTLHERNYGACMAARRTDLVRVGGADEHRDYLGHICGPYELTFRLGNAGVPEEWHPTEFLYHTWHPGQAGTGNYLGPHDGRHMSTTALEALRTGRTAPLVANAAVAALQRTPTASLTTLTPLLIAPNHLRDWVVERVPEPAAQSSNVPVLIDHYRGFNLVRVNDEVYGVPASAGTVDLALETDRCHPDLLRAGTLEALKKIIAAVPVKPADPLLVLEGYRHFNVVWWNERYYAVPQGEGDFDPERVRQRDYSRAYEGRSAQEVTARIDRDMAPGGWRSVLRVGRRRSRSPNDSRS